MHDNTLSEVFKNKLIVIVRGQAAEGLLALARALEKGGVRMMEITFDQKAPASWSDTARAIRTVRDAFEGRMRVGAGTVMRMDQLEMAGDAGAEFIISPNVNREIIRATRDMGLVSLPGALTPTEIAEAYDCGADAVKVFPAANLGPSYIKALRAPMGHIPLLAVGGVNENNCGDFIAAGCAGVGVGGGLVDKKKIEAGAWDDITALAGIYVKAVS
jgi:2-dehydro-3-deoxyphosphogluconate aldolase/(4S)-4-hydroxy-2-oxoglutarate aldolase